MLKYYQSRSRGMGFSLLLLASIAGCSYTPFSTINALRAIDPLTTPAKDVRVMVALPPVLLPQKDEVKLAVSLSATGALPAQNYAFRLQQIPKGETEMRVGQDFPTYTYRIHPDDFAQFEALRAVKDDQNREGSLSVGASACRKTSEIPHEVKVTVYLKTAELQDYVILVRNADILEGVTPDKFAIAIPICTSSNSAIPALK